MDQITSQKTLIAVVGPTASGKTAAAIQLAQYFNTVVISADSRQFYSEMSIGTAKPTPSELAAVKHFFIDSLSINETYSVGDYEKEAIELVTQLFKEHDKVIVAGGSGLFVKAICEGFDQFPDIQVGIREKLNVELVERGIKELQERLKTVDQEYYGQVDLNNPQRVIRALEVFESTGKTYSSFRTKNTAVRPFNIIKLGLNLPREALYARINARVDDMLSNGLVEEVRSLLPSRHLNALNTVGYSELFDYFDGKCDLARAVEQIKQNTRRFAKRQLTWFRKDGDITWFKADEHNLIADLLSAIKSR
jgi:tRNA dimethylallyltransferase